MNCFRCGSPASVSFFTLKGGRREHSGCRARWEGMVVGAAIIAWAEAIRRRAWRCDAAEQQDKSKGCLGTRPSVSARFEKLVRDTAVEGWDDEGAPAISREQWEDARRLVERIRQDVPPAPEVYPSACGDGTIHVRWSDPERILDLEIAGRQLHWSAKSDEIALTCRSGSFEELTQSLRELFSVMNTNPIEGCLGCNHDEMAAELLRHGVDESRFTEVPPSRHAWNDIVPCGACGRHWLMTLATTFGKEG